jgi:GT2 family glycosyltransferase
LPPGVQLIVVDASQDATPELVQTLRPHNTLLLRCASTVTQARQWGAEAAETTWLLFTDADVIFPPDYFERLRGYRGYDALYGPKLSTDEFRSYYRWFAQGQRLAHALGMPAASGSNLLVKRQVLRDIGGFDLELTCNEDSELAWRVKRRGYRVDFAPDLVVYARDHRRLHRGVARKTLHSWVRCALLYFNLMPSRWREHDWGYWSLPRDSEELSKN